jgi:hypothetical protein
LGQEFRFLGKGCQSYAFVSHDGQYVLKFIKHQRVQPPLWMDCCYLVPQVRAARSAYMAHRREGIEQLCASWRLAFEELREESGLVCMHLDRTEGALGTVRLVARGGVEHQVDLDQTPFLLQRLAEPFDARITQLVRRGELEVAAELLDQLVDLILTDYWRGVADQDRWVAHNSGVVDGRVMHLDVGLFACNVRSQDPELCRYDLFIKGTKLLHWLRRLSPELATHLEGRLRHELGDAYSSYRYMKRSPIKHEIE